MMRVRCAAFAAITVLALAIPALAATELPRTIAPLDRQTSDEQIARDRAAIAGWTAVLDSLEAGRPDPWRAAAARGWLRAAAAEYEDNDRTGFPQSSFARAVGLIGEMTSGAAPMTSETVPTAVPPRGSMKVADSIYVEIETMKRGPAFECVKPELAELETELAWAGNEQLDQGDCRTSPHFARALELIRAARMKAEACAPAPPIAIRETPSPAPAPLDTVTAPAPALPTREELQIPMNVHFGLDEGHVNPQSSQVIAGIVEILLKYPSITVRLEGHTDSRGNAAYNLALSRRRVNAVRDAMTGMGVEPGRISADAKGKSSLYATEGSKRGFALNRRVEMVFVDPEGRDIQTTRQERDIQLESDQEPTRKR